MNTYKYDGPVGRLYPDKEICICHRWKATTSADTIEKALANLAYRFKCENNMSTNAKISLSYKHVTNLGYFKPIEGGDFDDEVSE